jgi:hypothetical protein
MFMGSHPDVASLGELNMLGKVLSVERPCTCGAPLRTCAAWRDVFDRLQQEVGIDMPADPYGFHLWHVRARFNVDRARQTASYERRAKLINACLYARRLLPASFGDYVPLPGSVKVAVENKMRLLGDIARVWGVQVVVDSSKNALEAIELARRWPDAVRVVLLMRDGRGVYYSHRTTGADKDASLRSWVHYYSRSAPLLQRHVPAQQLMCLRYEDFASNPKESARSLCDWLGLSPFSGMATLSGSAWHMVDGNETRFSAEKGIRLDERWRAGLVNDELSHFEAAAGALNRRLGYVT